MRNSAMVSAVRSRYRESRVGNLHVYAGRFLVAYMLLIAAGTLGVLLWEWVLLPSDTLWYAGASNTEIIAGSGLISAFFNPLPAAAVTAAWCGLEGVS